MQLFDGKREVSKSQVRRLREYLVHLALFRARNEYREIGRCDRAAAAAPPRVSRLTCNLPWYNTVMSHSLQLVWLICKFSYEPTTQIILGSNMIRVYCYDQLTIINKSM